MTRHTHMVNEFSQCAHKSLEKAPKLENEALECHNIQRTDQIRCDLALEHIRGTKCIRGRII